MEAVQEEQDAEKMSEGTKQRRTERAGALTERFSHKRSIEKIVEKDFTLDVSINHQISRVYSKAVKNSISQLNACFTRRTDSLSKLWFPRVSAGIVQPNLSSLTRRI